MVIYSGLGGAFVVLKGKVKQHLLKPSLEPSSDANDRFHFFNMSSPLVAVGTFLSNKGVRSRHVLFYVKITNNLI